MVKPGIIKNAMAKLSRSGVLFKKKKKNINNDSGDNNNSNEEEKTKEMVDAAAESFIKRFYAQLKKQKHAAMARVAAFGDGGGGDGSGGDDDGSGGDGGGSGGDGSGGDGDGGNDGGDKTEGGAGGKMGNKMEPKGQHDDYRNSYSYHGGDENGYPVGQLDGCNYQAAMAVAVMAAEAAVMATAIMMVGIKLKAVAIEKWIPKWGGGQLHRCYYEKPNVCSIIPNQLLV